MLEVFGLHAGTASEGEGTGVERLAQNISVGELGGDSEGTESIDAYNLIGCHICKPDKL